MILTKEKIESFEQRYKIAFINSLAGFRQAVLIGTTSSAGQTNLAIFNSIIHLGANPALFAFISRPDTVERDTLRNIMQTGEYTLNYVSAMYAEKAHQTSARYSSSVSEFAAVGFNEQYVSSSRAPFVEEAVVKIAMKFVDKIDINVNGTIMIIGSVESVVLDDQLVGVDGFVNLTQAEVLVSCGLDAYYQAPMGMARLPYAKPD